MALGGTREFMSKQGAYQWLVHEPLPTWPNPESLVMRSGGVSGELLEAWDRLCIYKDIANAGNMYVNKIYLKVNDL